jgi:hypothetical protein
MGKKALIPEEKWEGLRHAMEEAAGARKSPKTAVILPDAEEEAARTARGKKRGGMEEADKDKDKDKDKEKRKDRDRQKKKDKKEKKKKDKTGKKKKGKKGKGKKKKGRG